MALLVFEDLHAPKTSFSGRIVEIEPDGYGRVAFDSVSPPQAAARTGFFTSEAFVRPDKDYRVGLRVRGTAQERNGGFKVIRLELV